VRVRSHSSLSWYMLAFNATTISIDFFASPTCGYITATGTDRRTCRTCCTVHPASRSGCLSPIADGEYVEQDQPHRSPTLLEDRNVFAADYTPKPAPSRTTPMEPLALNLSPGIAPASTPTNVICRGPPRTGKTACVRALFAEIKERAENPLISFLRRLPSRPDTGYHLRADLFNADQPCSGYEKKRRDN